MPAGESCTNNCNETTARGTASANCPGDQVWLCSAGYGTAAEIQRQATMNALNNSLSRGDWPSTSTASGSPTTGASGTDTSTSESPSANASRRSLEDGNSSDGDSSDVSSASQNDVKSVALWAPKGSSSQEVQINGACIGK